MNDMRLPGIGPFSADALASSGTEAPRDPAQAFDAVMSRFAGDRQRPNTNAAPAKEKTPASNESKGPKAAPAEQARPGDKPAKSDKTDGTAANGKPVSRTKGEGSGDGDGASTDGADSSTASAATDPAVLAALAAAAGAAPSQTPDATRADAGNPATAGKETKAATDGAHALDVLPGETTAGAGRRTNKPADPRIAIGEDTGPPAGANAAARRQPAAAKDTLRIEAPLMRAMETVQAEAAARATVGAGALARGTSTLAAATQDATPQAMTAAIAAATQTQGSTATYSIAHTAVGAPVGTSAFADELSQKVVMFAGQKVQRADIAVTPADLGPIAVSIEVRGQEATLAFAASSHATRAAIEDALPKLRDMLSAQGLHLAGTHVGSEPRRDSYRPNQSTGGGGSGARRPTDAVGATAPADAPGVRRRVNLIDIEV